MTPTASHLHPQKLFSTPQQQSPFPNVLGMPPMTPSTPGASSKMSDVESLDSVEIGSTTVTPDFSRMKLGRGRGRLRKTLVHPMVDDFPQDGTDEEKTRYIRKKTTELWRFKQLTSSNLAEYRAKENARVKEYHKRKA